MAATSAPLGARGSGAGSLPVRAKASNRIGAAAARPTRPGTGAPSGAADPDADRALAVEADRPGVAIAVGGAGLEGDAAAGGVLRRRRAEQHVADIPGGDRIHQPARRRLVPASSTRSIERHRRAEPREAGIEHHQIGERDADAAEPHRQARHFALRQHQRRRRPARAAR